MTRCGRSYWGPTAIGDEGAELLSKHMASASSCDPQTLQRRCRLQQSRWLHVAATLVRHCCPIACCVFKALYQSQQMPLLKGWCDPGASTGDMSISTLNISANNIGDQGAAAIAELLRSNTVSRFPDPHCRISRVSLPSSVADLVHCNVSVLPVCIRVTACRSTNIWLQQLAGDYCVTAACKR